MHTQRNLETMLFVALLVLVGAVYCKDYAPDASVLRTLNISLVPAPGLSLSEAFGDIFANVSDFNNFNIVDHVDVLASGFVWLESPVYVSNSFLQGVLFSDVKIEHLGRTYFWDQTTNETRIFIDNAGIIGSSNNDWLIKFRNFSEWVELGPNGMYLSQDGESLFMAQHGNRQIIQLDLANVDETNQFVSSCNISVIADEYNSISLNSPNDMTFTGDEQYIYFTDPPFGLQRFDDVNINSYFNQRDLTFNGIYVYDRESNLLKLFDDTMPAPNGISISDDNDKYLLVANTLNITSVEPFWRLYDLDSYNNNGILSSTDIKFDDTIWEKIIDFPLCDGIDYFGNNLFFAAGPSGIYIIDASQSRNGDDYILGRITIGDLVSNIDYDYPYLYVTANTNLFRICLKSYCSNNDTRSSDNDNSDSTNNNDSHSNDDTTLIYILVGIGVVALVVLIALLWYCQCLCPKNKKQESNSTEDNYSRF